MVIACALTPDRRCGSIGVYSTNSDRLVHHVMWKQCHQISRSLTTLLAEMIKINGSNNLLMVSPSMNNVRYKHIWSFEHIFDSRQCQANDLDHYKNVIFRSK